VRAIAIDLGDGRTQVSTNVHDPIAVPLASVVQRVRDLAAAVGARLAAAEVVGLAPEAAVAGMPADLPLPGFDPAKHVIERRVRP
jgi:glutamate formiminotransferase/glutamate formiminotransferase/formiminotetrahydrofolate cyclodeaminase